MGRVAHTHHVLASCLWQYFRSQKIGQNIATDYIHIRRDHLQLNFGGDKMVIFSWGGEAVYLFIYFFSLLGFSLKYVGFGVWGLSILCLRLPKIDFKHFKPKRRRSLGYFLFFFFVIELVWEHLAPSHIRRSQKYGQLLLLRLPSTFCPISHFSISFLFFFSG